VQISDLSPDLQAKYERLRLDLGAQASLLVAFSGGVDSGLVAAAAYRVLGQRMLAVTIQSPVETEEGIEAARVTAAAAGFPHQVVAYNDLSNPMFVENPPNRCYHCKLNRLGELKKMAVEEGFAAMAEGSNAEDRGEYRPGERAVAELKILSPLAQAGLVKWEIRELAQALGLPNWDRPSAPCLATRFPYGAKVTLEGIRQVDQAESFLKQQGFAPVRVRHYGSLARIEVAPAMIARLVAQREDVAVKFKELGFIHTAVDLMGYRSGSLDEGLNLV
jgi:pyridinium-3,5-biscarboxylic acid mononucleotide sulfurtransferase